MLGVKFSINKMVAVRHLGFSYFFAIFIKNPNGAHFYVDVQNLVKIEQSAPELLRIFYFQNGGSPPSWIWHDVIADHTRLVFDGPNIFLKLHFDRVYTLKNIAMSRIKRPCTLA